DQAGSQTRAAVHDYLCPIPAVPLTGVSSIDTRRAMVNRARLGSLPQYEVCKNQYDSPRPAFRRRAGIAIPNRRAIAGVSKCIAAARGASLAIRRLAPSRRLDRLDRGRMAPVAGMQSQGMRLLGVVQGLPVSIVHQFQRGAV